jgi:hypothetical protein
MVEPGWIPLEVTHAHLQDLVSYGFMRMVELATYRFPKDPASTIPVRGYVVACMTFYERGFSMPSHQFFCSLLWFYDLELHHLTPLEVLHIVTFVTLCEAYMGIESHFDLWNHFFRARLLLGSCAEVAVLGRVDIYVKSRHGVDPNFDLPVSDSMDKSWKVWFFMRNDTDTPLPMFMDSHPIQQPNWGVWSGPEGPP